MARPKPSTVRRVADNLKTMSSRCGKVIPAEPLLSSIVADLLTERGDKVNLISRLREDASPEADFVHAELRWHKGSGYLGTLIWNRTGNDFNAERTDQLETLAILILGGNSHAVDRWSRALGMR